MSTIGNLRERRDEIRIWPREVKIGEQSVLAVRKHRTTPHSWNDVSPYSSAKNLRNKEHLRWCMDNKINFSWFAYDILKRKKTLSLVFMQVLDEATGLFRL